MTIEQAIKRINDKQSQINNLQKEIRETQLQIKQLCPLKVGDLVLVNGDKKVYISGIEYKSTHPYFRYKFSKPKKDGTMGMQSAGIYYYKSVDKINTEQD